MIQALIKRLLDTHRKMPLIWRAYWSWNKYDDWAQSL